MSYLFALNPKVLAMKSHNLVMKYKRGFTLIEIVIGIVVLASALVIVSSIFLPQANRMTTPMYQIKSTALAKSMMNQVLIRYYDEENLSSGSFAPCTVCTTAADFGIENDEKLDEPENFNDVDDYHVYCNSDPVATLALFTDAYPGYGLNICVTNAADKFEPSSSADDVAKRVTVTVFMPNNETLVLSSLKGNY